MLTREDTEEIPEIHGGFDLHDLLNVLGSIFFEPYKKENMTGTAV
jgi:hypothetical protein